MNAEKFYDVIIVGGGLAGLSLSILLAKQHRQVLLIEKKEYPYHKVCGEYISNESKPFLEKLGLDIKALQLPSIDKFTMSSIKGTTLSQTLDMGGFGISRYLLDFELSKMAKQWGVDLLENTLCTGFEKVNETMEVKTNNGIFHSKILVASFGKYAFGNFYQTKKPKTNWIGVKYHIKHNLPSDTVTLHTFNGGYCGTSQIENNVHCLCYIVDAKYVKKYKGDIAQFEKNELYKNKYLRNIFEEADFLFEKPLTISNITFAPKKQIHKDVFYVGDASGTIAPLTGNGMSNAFRGASLLAKLLGEYFNGEINKQELHAHYARVWCLQFNGRIQYSRMMQHIFCKPFLTSKLIFIISKNSFLKKFLIRLSHGRTFE